MERLGLDWTDLSLDALDWTDLSLDGLDWADLSMDGLDWTDLSLDGLDWTDCLWREKRGRLFQTRKRTFGFHKTRAISYFGRNRLSRTVLHAVL